MTVDLDLDHLAEVEFVGFSTAALLSLLPLSILHTLETNHYVQLTFKELRVMLFFLWG